MIGPRGLGTQSSFIPDNSPETWGSEEVRERNQYQEPGKRCRVSIKQIAAITTLGGGLRPLCPVSPPSITSAPAGGRAVSALVWFCIMTVSNRLIDDGRGSEISVNWALSSHYPVYCAEVQTPPPGDHWMDSDAAVLIILLPPPAAAAANIWWLISFIKYKVCHQTPV